MLTLREHRDLEKLLCVGIDAYRAGFETGSPSAKDYALFRAVQTGWSFLSHNSRYVCLVQLNTYPVLQMYLLKFDCKQHRRRIIIRRAKA